jgi:hypothetical protein
MNVQWIRRDHRLDIELGVALGLGGDMLVKARTARQLDEAIVYNLRLWRSVRMLSQCCPGLNDREILADTADHIASMLAVGADPSPDPRDVSFVAGRNFSLAGDLAGAAALENGRDSMLALWAAEPGKARFDSWLLGRLGGADCHH